MEARRSLRGCVYSLSVGAGVRLGKNGGSDLALLLNAVNLGQKNAVFLVSESGMVYSRKVDFNTGSFVVFENMRISAEYESVNGRVETRVNWDSDGCFVSKLGPDEIKTYFPERK